MPPGKPEMRVSDHGNPVNLVIIGGGINGAVIARDAANLSSAELAAVGITRQRKTIMLWDKNTGQPLCKALGLKLLWILENVEGARRNYKSWKKAVQRSFAWVD